MRSMRMKSFRLYLKHPFVAPTRVVADYQPEELEKFRSAFRPAAQRYRRCMRIGLLFAAVFALGVLSAITFPQCRSWIGIPIFAFWSVVMLLAILSPVPDCPACDNSLDLGLGDYCPECGVKSLHSRNGFGPPICSSCGRRISRGKARHYKIRACTHCGVPLDEDGI